MYCYNNANEINKDSCVAGNLWDLFDVLIRLDDKYFLLFEWSDCGFKPALQNNALCNIEISQADIHYVYL